MPNVPVLEMRNIAKVFGKFYALKGVDLTVWPGEDFHQRAFAGTVLSH